MRSMQALSNLQNILKLLLTAVLLQMNGPTMDSISGGILLSYAITVPFSFALVLLRVRSENHTEEHFSNIELLREVIPYGLMYSIIQSLGAVFSAANTMLLGYLTPPEQATSAIAVFTVATTLPYALLPFPSAVATIFMPVMSRLYGKGQLDDMRSAGQTAQRWMLLLSLPVPICLIAFA